MSLTSEVIFLLQVSVINYPCKNLVEGFEFGPLFRNPRKGVIHLT